MGLIEYAKLELDKAGYFDKDSDYEGAVGEAVMELIKVFASQEHSGFSASLVRSLFNKLADYKPLSGITGEDDEWNIVSYDNWETVAITENAIEEADALQKILDEKSEDVVYQNKRISGVFKHGKKGIPYYLDAIVFQGAQSWDTFTGQVEDISSSQNINFPFTPKTFYIDVYREYHPLEWFEKNNMSYSETDSKEYYLYQIKDRKQLEEVFKFYKKKENEK